MPTAASTSGSWTSCTRRVTLAAERGDPAGLDTSPFVEDRRGPLTAPGHFPYGRAMEADDIDLRNATYRRFVELGHAPTASEVAGATGSAEATVREGWQRLHDAHALVLDDAGEIRMANPFAAEPTPFQVEAAGRSWFANCAWDAFGIGAALKSDSTIHTECPDCREPLDIVVHNGRPDDSDLFFHVLVPAASWWSDIGYT